MNQAEAKNIFKFIKDFYRGATIDSSFLPEKLPEFKETFEATLAYFLDVF
jgi:hypothetical protein